MEITVCNFAKSRLETIDINITGDNITWFEDTAENKGIKMLTDFDGSLLISEHNYDYPVLIYDVTRMTLPERILTAYSQGFGTEKITHMKSNQPQGRAGSCPPLGLCQIFSGEKVFKAIFLIKVGQFSVVISMQIWFWPIPYNEILNLERKII